jgi:hypothetical protein
LPLGHCVVAEAGCNWYHLDINTYSLSKKVLPLALHNNKKMRPTREEPGGFVLREEM